MIWTAVWSVAPAPKIVRRTRSVCPPGLGVHLILFKPGSRAKTPQHAAARNVAEFWFLTAEAQRSQRKLSFSFPLRGQKTKNLALRARFYFWNPSAYSSQSIISLIFSLCLIWRCTQIVCSDFPSQEIRTRKRISACSASLR